MRVKRFALFAALTAVATPALAAAPTFTKIIDTTTTGGYFVTNDFYDAPMVNNSGVAVLMNVNSPVGYDPAALYTGSGGPVTTVATVNSSPFTNLSWADINNAGTVAFYGSQTGGARGIYTRTGNGPVAPVVQTGATFSTIYDPHLSANGNLAFSARTLDGGWGAYRTTTSGGGLITIAQDANPNNSIGASAVNNVGTVAFLAYDSAQNVTSVNTGNGVSVTNYGGTNLNILGDADINNPGTLALESVVAVTKMDSPTSSTVVSSNAYSAFHSYSFDFFRDVGIADDGTVAFGAIKNNGVAGIFIGPDPLADKIIADGDPLFGSNLTSFMFNGGISYDGRHIAFAYHLANGVEGVAVAAIPEPSAAALLLLPALQFLRRRRIGAGCACRL